MQSTQICEHVKPKYSIGVSADHEALQRLQRAPHQAAMNLHCHFENISTILTVLTRAITDFAKVRIFPGRDDKHLLVLMRWAENVVNKSGGRNVHTYLGRVSSHSTDTGLATSMDKQT